jgi:hypothetical protein
MAFNADIELPYHLTGHEIDQLATTIRWSTMVQQNLLHKLMTQMQEHAARDPAAQTPAQPPAQVLRGNSGVSHSEPAAQP